MPTDCVTLWIGDRLGSVERACLRSVLRQGHTLALYCYDEPTGVPENVEVRDAAGVLPRKAIVRHRSGSVALFSDWFRYELQKRDLGTWIDTDNYFIASIDMGRPYLLAKQVVSRARPWRRLRESINGNVLRLPPDSPMLPPLLARFNRRCELSTLPWGTAGPFALTDAAEQFGLASTALPSDVFNPVPWHKADWILDRRKQLEDMVTEQTVCVHLWNECIRSFKDQQAPPDSFLERLHAEGA